jgi:hypothetical protein
VIEIPLSPGKYGPMSAFVDDADFDLVSQYKWYPIKHRNTFYARTNIGKRASLLMHVLLVGKYRDHKDRNGLNNRRSNLRPATHSQNRANSKLYRNNTSGYRGVSFHAKQDAWHAKIVVEGRRIWLGAYLTAESAARAYNEAAREHFGEFASLNELKEIRLGDLKR